MPVSVRVATFNCENLFARYNFKKNVDYEKIRPKGWDINDLAFVEKDHEKRLITKRAIQAVDADILALQEVEDMDVLKHFRSQYLGGPKNYPYMMMIDGNDPRFIDVAILSRHPITAARTWQYVKEKPSSRSYVFSRDCLEVNIDIKGFELPMFVNHFKSMMGGRSKTKPRRVLQAETVKKLVTKRFGTKAGDSPFIILGDLNDYPLTDSQGSTGLGALLNWKHIENTLDRLPEPDRWTHYYKGKKTYTQLDYIFVSTALKNAVQTVGVERRGMPKRATRVTTFFPGVDMDDLKASDHCPLYIDLKL